MRDGSARPDAAAASRRWLGKRPTRSTRPPASTPSADRAKRFTILIATGALCLPALLRPQEPTFDEQIRVSVVEVDVRVTDKKGRPVTGLSAEDFILFDDGQVVPIEYFTVMEPRRATDGAKEPRSGSRDVDDGVASYTPVDAFDLPLLAIYLDNLSLRPAERSRVLDDVSRFVESVDDGRPITLLTFDGSLSVAVRPTTDVAAILAGLQTAAGQASQGYQRELDEDRTLAQIKELYLVKLRDRPPPLDCGAESDFDGDWREFVQIWRVYAEEQAALSRRLAAGLIEAVTTLAPIDGRKDLVYVSSGLDRMPGLALNEVVAELCPAAQTHIRREMNGYDLSTVLHQTTAHANRSRVTIHTLDAGGMRPLTGSSVRNEDARFRFSSHASQLRTANLQAGLFTIAEDTGGRAILNANQPFDALQAVRTDIQHGYILGFSPDRPPDVRTHHTRVSLAERRKGVEISYRQTYVDPNEDEALVERLLAALQLGWGGNPLGAAAVVGEPERLSSDAVEAPVRIAVPAEAIAQSGARESGDGPEVQVVGVAVDSRGRRTVVRRRHIPIGAPIESPTGGGALHLFEIRMRLPPERYRIGVSLEVEGAGRASYVVVEADLRQ